MICVIGGTVNVLTNRVFRDVGIPVFVSPARFLRLFFDLFLFVLFFFLQSLSSPVLRPNENWYTVSLVSSGSCRECLGRLVFNRHPVFKCSGRDAFQR